MATVFYYGRQTLKRAKKTFTITYAAGQTYTFTGNGKDVVFTATANETTAALVAAALVLACSASKESNHSELAYSSSGALFIVDGPEDGANFSASGAATGGGAFATTSSVSGTSPNDWGDDANFDAPPEDGDLIVVPKGCPHIRHNLDARDDKTGMMLVREFGGGKVGLPDFRANGQAEWREVAMSLVECVSVTLYVSETDAQSLRFNFNTFATSVQILGAAQSNIGSEVVEVNGFDDGGVIRCTGCSFAVGTEQAAGALGPIVSINSTGRILDGVEPSHISFTGGTGNVSGGWFGNMKVDGGATVAVLNGGSGRPVIEGGTVVWAGSGDCISPIVGSDGFLDFDGGIGAVAVTGVNDVHSVSSSAAATGGSATFVVSLPAGGQVTTGAATWNATDATLVANVQAVVDAATGVTGGIVVSAGSGGADQTLTFTHSGTGYAGNSYNFTMAKTFFTSWANVYTYRGSNPLPKQITRTADNARVRDSAGRVTRPVRLVNSHCTMDGENVQFGNHTDLTISDAA